MKLPFQFILLFIILWITCAPAFGWGDLGHRLVAEYGSELASPKALANCHVSVTQLTAHTNDPDRIWRQQRFAHPNEAQMHYFHVDRQPGDWRLRQSPKDPTQGWLVYRIGQWTDEARELRRRKEWDALSERLYGLSHYIGDLTQPLHLNHDYDGEEAGLPDIHSQFETKMLNRFEDKARAGVRARLASENIPALWSKTELRRLIFDVAFQSSAKVGRLFTGARPAYSLPRVSRRRKTRRPPEPRFEKKLLWQGTGELALDQLALGARVWGYLLNSICQEKVEGFSAPRTNGR